MKPLPMVRSGCSVKVMTAVMTVVCRRRELFAANGTRLTEKGEIDPESDERKGGYQNAVF